jgi:hypothetical protein
MNANHAAAAAEESKASLLGQKQQQVIAMSPLICLRVHNNKMVHLLHNYRTLQPQIIIVQYKNCTCFCFFIFFMKHMFLLIMGFS